MNPKFLIFICFVILFLCEKALGGLIIRDVTIDKNASTMYKQGGCSYSLTVLVIDDSSPSQLSINTNSNQNMGFNVYAFYGPSYKNSTYSSTIFSISISSYSGDSEPVLIASNNIVNSTLFLPLKCLEIQTGQMTLLKKTDMEPDIFGLLSYQFQVSGLISNYPSGGIIGYNSYNYLMTNYVYYSFSSGPKGDIPKAPSTEFVYSGLSVSLDEYYNNTNVDSVTNFKRFPSLNQDVQLMGKSFVPLFTFESDTPYLIPGFSLKVGTTFPNFYFRPISKKNNITTFIGAYGYINNGELADYSFYAQYQSTSTVRDTFSFNIKEFDNNLIPVDTNNITQINNWLVIDFSSNSPYDFTPFYITHLSTKYYNFPFGFKQGGTGGYKYSATFLLPDIISNPQNISFSTTNGFKTSNGDGFSLKVYSPNTAPYNPPVYVDHKFDHIYDSFYLLQFKIESESPIYKISNDYRDYFITALSSGTDKNGWFEMIVDTRRKFTFIVANQFRFFSPSFDHYYSSINLKTFKIPPVMDNIDFYNEIRDASILYKTMNVTNSKVGNILYFNYTNLDIKTPISLLVNAPEYMVQHIQPSTGLPEEYLDKLVPAIWNSTINMFQVEFFLPKNSLPGKIPFALFFKNDLFILGQSLGPNAQFNVISENCDSYGPIFENIIKLSNTLIDDFFLVGWNLTISDPINGFGGGYIIIKGSDGSIYNKTLIPTDNIYSDTYFVLVNISIPCAKQTLTITDVVLFDTENNNSTFSIFNEFEGFYRSLFNPFINFIDDNSINKILVNCITEVTDGTPPEIISLNVSSDEIDISSNSRGVSISFNAVDSESGLKNGALPMVYLSTVDLDKIECPITMNKTLDKFNSLYECTVNVPLGFGYPYGLLISIYGLVNNGGTFGGYSTADLKGKGFAHSINTTFALGEPVIEGVSRISTLGGELWITGKGLLGVDYAVLGSGKFLISKTIGNSAILVTGIPSLTPKLRYSILVFKGAYISNSIEFIPYEKVLGSPSPTETPSTTPSTTPTIKCAGTPECGGSLKGYCNSGNCVCFSPWVGVDCTSKIIIVEPPRVNTSDPSSEIETPTSNSSNIEETAVYKSFVALISLRELDFNDVIINQYYFSKWLFSEISPLSSRYITNITNNDGKPISQVTAITEWFTKETNISFAGSDLTMNPSSLKYTISIDSYPFRDKLCRLELLMSASFTSSKTDDICSSQEFITTASSSSSSSSSSSTSSNSYNDNESSGGNNYLKIQIGDHSMFARFLKRGIIDDRTVTIDNRQIINDDKTTSTIENSGYHSSALIGILIPYFKNYSIIDPDFSVIIDHQSSSPSSPNSICSQTSNSGLSKSSLAGIIIGGVAFFFVIVICIIYFLYKSNPVPFKLIKQRIFLSCFISKNFKSKY
ncbi:hypothetical protein ACTFIZ_009364 [Dictyostelium cf. discoideum]